MVQGRKGMRRLCLLLAGAIVAFAGQTALVQAQQDPNDPWPQYGHDERNTCNSPYRGPHAMPELLWWDELPALKPLSMGTSPSHRGAAIARFDGETYVFAVGAESVGGVSCTRLYQYIARPPMSHTPGTEWDPVWTSDLMKTAGEGGACDSGDPIWAGNTPLVLRHPDTGHVLVVVQTEDDVRAYDRTSGGTSPIWCTPNVGSADGCSISSPCYGSESVGGDGYLYVTGRETGIGTILRKIDPSDGSVVWTFDVDSPRPTSATPAIGAISFTPPTGLAGSNVVYLTTCGGWYNPGDDCCNFHGVFAGGTTAVQTGRGVLAPQGFKCGSYASVSVHANGDPIIGADDGLVYGFSSTPSAGEYTLRWPTYAGLPWISATAGIAEIDAERYVFFNTEALYGSDSFPAVHVFSDAGTSCSSVGVSTFRQDPGDEYGTVGGSPVIDSRGRAYYLTGWRDSLVGGSEFAGGGIAAFPEPTSTSYSLEWTFNPASAMRSDANGSLAMDEYGILYMVNEDYILALRPPFGDFDGDGVVGSVDCADDLCAYLLYRGDPDAWETQFGSVYGINVLGIADADNDGRITNNDIGTLSQVWDCTSPPTCP